MGETSEAQIKITVDLCLEILTSFYMQRLSTQGKTQKQALELSFR